jgi:hypothetical protein
VQRRVRFFDGFGDELASVFRRLAVRGPQAESDPEPVAGELAGQRDPVLAPQSCPRMSCFGAMSMSYQRSVTGLWQGPRCSPALAGLRPGPA